MFFKPPPGPVDSSQHFSVRLPLRVCKNILHSNIDKYQFQYILHILISQSKQQTDWIYFLLSGDSQLNIFVSGPGDESSSHVSVTCDKWALMCCSGETAALQPLVLTSDNVKVMVSPCSPRWLVSDMINGERRSVRGAGLSREGTAHWSDSRVIVTIQSPLKWNETLSLSPLNESLYTNCNLLTYNPITRIVAVDRRVWTGAACDSWAVSWTSEHKNVARRQPGQITGNLL